MEKHSSKIQKKIKNIAEVAALEHVEQARSDKKIKPAIVIGAVKMAKKDEKVKILAAKKTKVKKSTKSKSKSKSKAAKPKAKAKKSSSRSKRR